MTISNYQNLRDAYYTRFGMPRKKHSLIERFLDRHCRILYRIVGIATNILSRQRLSRTAIGELFSLSGRLAANISLFGAEDTEHPIGAAYWFVTTMQHLGCRFEVTSIEETKVEIEMVECPGSLKSKRACAEGMRADGWLVWQLGGLLRIGHRIVDGAPRCRLEIVEKPKILPEGFVGYVWCA